MEHLISVVSNSCYQLMVMRVCQNGLCTMNGSDSINMAKIIQISTFFGGLKNCGKHQIIYLVRTDPEHFNTCFKKNLIHYNSKLGTLFFQSWSWTLPRSEASGFIPVTAENCPRAVSIRLLAGFMLRHGSQWKCNGATFSLFQSQHLLAVAFAWKLNGSL